MDPKFFRSVLGQYPTGVAVVTAKSNTGEPLAMTVGSFTSVSLEPPLVAFLPDKGSRSWAALQSSGNAFCVNMLGAHQEDVCRAIASRNPDKFAGIPWYDSPAGNPVIDGSVAFIDCVTEVVHDAGDHVIVVGAVQHLDILSPANPLVFFRGGYGSFHPSSLTSGDRDLMVQLKAFDVAREPVERLADRFTTEVQAVTLLHGEVVLFASAGRAPGSPFPTRVGMKSPFAPPVGGVFAAWGSDHLRAEWLHRGATHAPGEVLLYERMLDRIKDLGYAFSIGHAWGESIEQAIVALDEQQPGASLETLRSRILKAAQGFNVEDADLPDLLEFREVTAPVFAPSGEIAFALTIWGPAGTVPRGVIEEYADALLACTVEITERLTELRLRT